MKRNIVLLLACLTFVVCSSDVYAQKTKKKTTKQQATEQKAKPATKQSKSTQAKSKDTKQKAQPAVKQAKPKTTENRTVKKIVNNMVFVKGGTFTMGATPEQQKDAYKDESPKHEVTLSNYYIGKFEVTQAEWEAVMGDNPSYFKGPNLPVESVSWNDCEQFVKKLNALSGHVFRLPTEAEWEYAARGGSKSKSYKYCGANSYNGIAWHKGNSAKKTHSVGQKPGNELGICDMSGNVYEWCGDGYGVYQSKAQKNPKGAKSTAERVYKGGSFVSIDKFLRTSFRSRTKPSTANPNLGLRLVMEK